MKLAFRINLTSAVTGNTFNGRVYLPVLKRAVKGSNIETPVWSARFSVTYDGKTRTRSATGAFWLQALLLATEGVRLELPSEQSATWKTDDGLPSWIVFPRMVPISWGENHHHEMLRDIQIHEQRLHSEIEKKYNLSGA